MSKGGRGGQLSLIAPMGAGEGGGVRLLKHTMSTVEGRKAGLRRRYIAKMKAARLCLQCTTASLKATQHWVCTVCAARNVANRRKLTVEKGICFECGVNPLVTAKRCEKCRLKWAQYQQDRRRQLISQGLCGSCGKSPLESESLCKACRLEMRDKARARYEAKRFFWRRGA